MRYYALNQKVLANCGTRDEPDWIPGIIIDVSYSQDRPYQIRLECKSDGKTVWFFPASFVIADTKQNRNNKNVKGGKG